MSTETRLKPCPFCGGAAKEFERFNANVITCRRCGVKVRQSEMGEGDAAVRWNQRATSVAAQPDITQQTLDDVMAGIPARDAEIEALRKEIEALQAAPVKPYSLDLDPAGIRALTVDAISGALALGFQGVSPPPNNEHWLAPFWEIGRESAVQAQQPVSGADGLPQAMLPARPTPEASNTFGLGLDGYTGAQMLTYGRACAEAQRKADSQAKLSGNTGELAREFANRIDQHQRTLANIEAFVACDASAISYQSLGQYRTALLRMLRQAPATKETGA